METQSIRRQADYKNNQQSLNYMTTQRITEGIQHKLLVKLLEFDYSIEYKGKENIVADAPSRRDTVCHAITSCVPDWIEEVKLSYSNNPDSSKLLKKSNWGCLVILHNTLFRMV